MCEESESNSKPSYIYKTYPVIFLGEYLGWDWFNTRIFKVVKRYKGLDETVQYMTLRSDACNLNEEPGEQFLISAYLGFSDSIFLSFSNCKGTFRADREKNKLAFFDNQVSKYGSMPIDLDNRNIKGFKQTVFNSANFDFILRDASGNPLFNQPRNEKNNLYLFIIIGLSLLVNGLLILKLRAIKKRRLT